MNAPIRVMIVDDSSVVRRMLKQALAAFEEIEVVAAAANGVIALSKIPSVAPEVVILDIEMPEMDGITTLTHLRRTHPRLPVIMFSTLTERGASVTFDALAAGASDYVLKPTTQPGESLDAVVTTVLVPKIIALARSRFAALMEPASAAPTDVAVKTTETAMSVGASATSSQRAPTSTTVNQRSYVNVFAPKPMPTLVQRAAPLDWPSSSEPATKAGSANEGSGTHVLPQIQSFAESPTGTSSAVGNASDGGKRQLQPLQAGVMTGTRTRKPVQVVAIASSTGGPNALAEVLPRLPGSLPVPIVIVQHMPPIFTRCLAERLARHCELTLCESEGRERIQPGHVYIAPGNYHLELVREADGHVYTMLSDGPPENSCRPAADVLFRSVARVYGGAVLGLVLTGMGQDGLRGARAIHEAGGRVLVQSGPTCVIWGMPRAVEEAGIAEAVVPLPELSAAILQRIGSGLLPLRDPPPEKRG